MSLVVGGAIRRLTVVPHHVLALTDRTATDPSLAGAKAANLARAAVAGFRTVPGVVITTTAVATGLDDPEVRASVLAIAELHPDTDLVVRSSSTIEDIGTSSMAGRFTSVLDVRGPDQLLSAVATVIASADRVRDTDGHRRPIAVVVQRQITAAVGGVMFGLDPVTGERHHIVIEAVAGGPDRLVGGTVLADHYVITRRGRFVRATHTGVAPILTRQHRHHLARTARRAERVFGNPQDIEWLIDTAGATWFLQSRPVTAAPKEQDRRDERHGSRFGPGPLAETFPAPLRPLEADLWITSLRTGITRALRTVGAVSPAAVERSPVVTVVDGRPAVDLDLIGLVDGHAALRRRYAPSRMLRRLATAWRVGRLRAAFPSLADSVIRTIDRDLAGIDRPDRLELDTLATLLTAAVDELATAHTYEILAGMLTAARDGGASGAGRALDALVDGRAAGWDDATIIERTPVVLVLVPPRLGVPVALPSAAVGSPRTRGELAPREELRIRVRWIQELTVRLVDEISRRLVDTGTIPSVDVVAHMRLDELVRVTHGAPAPLDLAERATVTAGAPLPTVFRLGPDDEIHPERNSRHARPPDAVGEPAGGGRATGIVVHDADGIGVVAADGEPVVLVTDHLVPDLAPVLGRIVGLVAETGSALSHLAILARESHVATVAGVPAARQRYPAGTRVVVDGTTGRIDALTDAVAVRR